MQKLVRLSASKLKLYERCPTAYVHKYISKRDDRVGIHGLLGTSVHKAIETKYRDPETNMVGTFINSFGQWINPEVEYFYMAQSLSNDAITWLETLDTNLYTPKVVDGKPVLEKYFKLPYPDTENPICTLEGYMDLVTDTSVVDWKTGKEVYSGKKVERDIQFVIYAWAYEQLYGYAPSEIVYHRLRDHKQHKGKKFDRTHLDELILQFINDPMTYEPIPCDNCPVWCSVKKQFNELELNKDVEVES